MYLFFVRHFNDIDHLTPIIWHMHRHNHPVGVFVMNPAYMIENDYRLLFLRQQGVRVQSLYGGLNDDLGWLHRCMRAIYRTSFMLGHKLAGRVKADGFGERLQQRFNRTGTRYFKRCRKRFYTRDWAQSLLKRTGARVLCFDWVAPWRFVTGPLMEAARRMDIALLSLPHGVFVYTNENVKNESVDIERNYRKFSRYDAVCVQNELFRKVITDAGISPDKVYAMGSARYCPQWVKQNKTILPRSEKPAAKRGPQLKIVFMTTRPNYRIDVERMLATFDLLAAVEGIDVVIKPHTRSGEEAKIYENLKLSNASDLSSVELCEWADVMIVIGSSILIETLLQQKPVLYLKYLHANTTLYEEMEACWTINDETELGAALNQLIGNQKAVPYHAQNARRFLNDIIYGAQEAHDVLVTYENFIVRHAQPARDHT